MAYYSLINLGGDNVSLSSADDQLFGSAFNWKTLVRVDGKEGSDMLTFDRKQSEITGLSIQMEGNVTTVEGQLVNVTNMFGTSIITKQYINLELVNFESIRFEGETAEFDWVNIGVPAAAPSSTADRLMQNFGLTVDVARNWVMNHMDKPADILAVCQAGGVSASMLAEIVQPAFVDITVTGQVVNDWFNFHALSGLV
jgi:hypothetical protein